MMMRNFCHFKLRKILFCYNGNKFDREESWMIPWNRVEKKEKRLRKKTVNSVSKLEFQYCSMFQLRWEFIVKRETKKRERERESHHYKWVSTQEKEEDEDEDENEDGEGGKK